MPGTLRKIIDADNWQPDEKGVYPLFRATAYLQAENKSTVQNFVVATIDELDLNFLSAVKNDPTVTLVLITDNEHAMPELRRAFFKLLEKGIETPVIIKR